MKRASVWILGAVVIGLLTCMVASDTRAAIVRWNLKQYCEYYDDAWVGEIVRCDLFEADFHGEQLTHTKLLIRGYSVVTGKKGYQWVAYMGGGDLNVSTMPLPINTRVGNTILVFLSQGPESPSQAFASQWASQQASQGVMWTSNFATLLRLESPRAASDSVVIAQAGSFLDKNKKLAAVEADIRATWASVKPQRNGQSKRGR